MAKTKVIKSKNWSFKNDVTADDMIVVDEYDDQTYRVWIPGDYGHDEIDRDFATVDSIRKFLRLQEQTAIEVRLTQRDELLNQIKEAKGQLEMLQALIDGQPDIKEYLPDITPSQEKKLEGLLILIEKNDTLFHRFWTDVRSVGIDEKGNQSFGPCQMIPPREPEDEDELDDNESKHSDSELPDSAELPE
jgi:hypothetical protein